MQGITNVKQQVSKTKIQVYKRKTKACTKSNNNDVNKNQEPSWVSAKVKKAFA